jgi:hypothetical protein
MASPPPLTTSSCLGVSNERAFDENNNLS